MIQHGSMEPTRTSLSDNFVQTVIRAAKKTYGKKAIVYPTIAGSGPIHLFRNCLGLQLFQLVVLMKTLANTLQTKTHT